MPRKRERTPPPTRASGTRRGGSGRRPTGGQGSAPLQPPADRSRERGADLDRSVDALFRLPLADFTAARNALAARLRKSKQAVEAEAVKALPRPTVVAWAVNQLYWGHREAFDHLLETGHRFYDAQMAQLSGTAADLRGALEARREALSDLTRRAADLLRAAGHATAPDTMRRITTTLDALSFGATARAGRLTEEVLPQGFDVLAPMVSRVPDTEPLPSDGPPRVLPFRPGSSADATPPVEPDLLREAARSAALAALEEAERALDRARLAARDAELALKKAAAGAKEAELEKTAAEERLRHLTVAAEEARAEALGVAVRAEEAAQALDDAERAREAAERHLQQVDRGELEPSGR
jgi:hypothetical protein